MITFVLPVAADNAAPPSDAERAAKTNGQGSGRASQRTMKAMAGITPGGGTTT